MSRCRLCRPRLEAEAEESPGRPAGGMLWPEGVAPQDGELLDCIVEVAVAVALDEPELGKPRHHGPEGLGDVDDTGLKEAVAFEDLLGRVGQAGAGAHALARERR